MYYYASKVEDNRNFLENKSYTLYLKNDDTISISNNVLAFCDRVWLDREFTSGVGWEFVYELKLSNNDIWETEIVEKGKDERGDYIVLVVPGATQHAYEGTERPNVPLGQTDVNVILSPEMIKGSDRLLKEFNYCWPSFHEAYLSIVQKTDKNMTLRFSGGFLFDKVVDVNINDITFENYDDSLEYFTKEWLTSVKFSKYEDKFEIRLYNDYRTSSLPEGFDISLLHDPDFDMSTLRDIEIIEEFKNHGVIQCKKIEMIVTIDEGKKKEMEEGYRRFLEGLTSESSSE